MSDAQAGGKTYHIAARTSRAVHIEISTSGAVVGTDSKDRVGTVLLNFTCHAQGRVVTRKTKVVSALNMKIGAIPSKHVFALMASLRDVAQASKLSLDVVDVNARQADSIDVLSSQGAWAAIAAVAMAREATLAAAEEHLDLQALATETGFYVPSLPAQFSTFIQLPFS